ncbi:MAG: hypothetical protein A2140_05665 [Candidatus Muproteobacteria bacterium RBG_16_62_13]|uniref:3-oxoacyl-ACP synthase n=1 Tax=Candidatus Muproteobacteria bacterium RBG_16_62_13 TaxID=1817756 RepID=A0A1F6T7T1_9PROT|nr:MAG: hypothetical protein A2140_05665 [Candidatus Muproteobacteria bacterium RBG_16_62_13]
MKRITVKDFSKLKKGKTDWARLRRMKDEEIDFSDIPELTDQELAQIVWTVPRAPQSGAKITISMRVDPDVLDWYKRLGRGYQSRMHMVLRAFMQARQVRGKPKKSVRRAA